MQSIICVERADEMTVLSSLLQKAGFSINSMMSCKRVVEVLMEQPVDLAIVSVANDNWMEWLEQVEKIRLQNTAVIVCIGEYITEDMQIKFLEAGGDLVIMRPYSVPLLVAQIRSLLRRTAGIPFFSLPMIVNSGVVLDPSARTVKRIDGLPKRLTQLEFRLLYTLMTHPGQIVPTENIVEHVWGYTAEGNRDLVRGLVQRLRSKIEENPHEPKYIITEAGVGYYFNRL